MQTGQKNWYAVYTKPRWEKKVYSLLCERGFEAYCPLNKVRKKWSDRIKWVEEPLFKSYVFVHVPESEQTKVRMVSGVVNFVYWLGKPAVVLEKEIQIIRKFLDEYTDVRAEPLRLPARHRAADPELARLVARRGDHPARAGTAHDDRLAAQVRPPAHLD